MRTVRLQGPLFHVTEDPDQVIGDFLGFALSLRNLSGRLTAEELHERFRPGGSGMRLPDVFAAYRARESDAVPPEFDGWEAEDLERRELWVLTRLRFGESSPSALVEGPELRHLLDRALALRGDGSEGLFL
ncbi:hypothetical protein GCM10009678_47160 [Actinomadura kijaniata]|uniref:Uncharacterized protein n=1 Tax=Actinomadura namibiensis TaxID=182080 RepID=A0A7W3LKX4_ACTNM|nr:hypothetical protein [Actinomadura namibiensis]MBA8949973.1 hypothetical protein [Actinomadura namibiensis]